MSRRNSREGKARRRAQRAANRQHAADLTDVRSLDEVITLAHAGEKLPCGCDAHEMLHEVLEIGEGRIPPGWHLSPS